jgi:hypothetical protein
VTPWRPDYAVAAAAAYTLDPALPLVLVGLLAERPLAEAALGLPVGVALGVVPAFLSDCTAACTNLLLVTIRRKGS